MADLIVFSEAGVRRTPVAASYDSARLADLKREIAAELTALDTLADEIDKAIACLETAKRVAVYVKTFGVNLAADAGEDAI